jgi:hypothetical protein
LYEELGDKKNVLQDAKIHKDLMSAFEAYGAALGTQIATEMLSEPSE